MVWKSEFTKSSDPFLVYKDSRVKVGGHKLFKFCAKLFQGVVPGGGVTVNVAFWDAMETENFDKLWVYFPRVGVKFSELGFKFTEDMGRGFTVIAMLSLEEFVFNWDVFACVVDDNLFGCRPFTEH